MYDTYFSINAQSDMRLRKNLITIDVVVINRVSAKIRFPKAELVRRSLKTIAADWQLNNNFEIGGRQVWQAFAAWRITQLNRAHVSRDGPGIYPQKGRSSSPECARISSTGVYERYNNNMLLINVCPRYIVLAYFHNYYNYI